jgi:predicted phage baseplate assembly protein
VHLPLLVEQFNNVTLQNVAATFAGASDLISVRSFSEEPNPSLSACGLMHYDANKAVPEITLFGSFEGNTTIWKPKPDLLESGAADTNFVVEIEFDGSAHLRFGNNTNGKFPESLTDFVATYRIGNGTAGNVGAESLVFLATGDARIRSCTNPLPASGGVDPETTDQIRRRAPQAFMTQERAITMPDYVAIAERNTQIDQAIATLRWTGSWYTVFIASEPKGGGKLTPALRKTLIRSINRFRLAGQDIELQSPQYLPLKIELTVCVDPSYFQADVRQGLMQVLGSQPLPDGTKGLFAPDTFTFGQTVYLSPIYAAARKVAGVTSVTATIFEPQGVNTTTYLDKGEIPLGPFQIAQMGNDRSFPNHGQLTLVLKGGK